MNKRRGWIDYHERMARVLAHVHAHLDDALDLAVLADRAHLSPHHWHRTYHALYGETLANTVRRLRLQRASGDLATSTRSVQEIAARSGYPSAQSFARAFKAAYGMAPLAFRKAGPHTAYLGKTAADLLPAGYTVDVRPVERVYLAGLPHRGSYMQIGRAFEGALPLLHAQGQVRPDSRWIALYLDDPATVPAGQLSARAGLSVPCDWRVPAPLQRFEVGGCTCAVLRYRGPYASMHAAYRWLFGAWLANSGSQVADHPVFEEYLNSPRDTAPADLLTDIYLPLADCEARSADQI